jgi:hypothetical protein
VNNAEARAAIAAADIKEDGWLEAILDKMTDRFRAGYLTCKAENLNEAFCRSEEEFREEILDATPEG